jgi:hypothetical protein
MATKQNKADNSGNIQPQSRLLAALKLGHSRLRMSISHLNTQGMRQGSLFSV